MKKKCDVIQMDEYKMHALIQRIGSELGLSQEEIDKIPLTREGMEKAGRAASRKAYAQFQEYAKKQGCPQEAVDKIPEMLHALVLQSVCKNYDGPTPEEVNPKFFE
jgi:hypothetical protein